MKLFTKYTRIYLLTTVIVFLLGSFAFALLLKNMLISQVDEDLLIEQNEIGTFINQNGKLPQIMKVNDQHTEYIPLAKHSPVSEAKFSTLQENAGDENETIRQIAFEKAVDGKWYLIKVSKSLEGTDNLIQSILIITFSVILLILVMNFLINRILLKKLWEPFYLTLEKIKQFKIGNKQTFKFEATDIDEFSLMNNILNDAVNKAQKDFLLLKEFTENASHELQTPLAVIRSKLDILIQNEQLNELQSQSLQAAYDALQKLSRMNQSLLLLTKIENRQFEETGQLSLKKILENKIAQFTELWQGRNITVEKELTDAIIKMNPSLFDVLLNNLLSNATRHNKNNGIIFIKLKQGELSITNTGLAQSLDINKLFSRFYKGVNSSEHSGLGLSIVKQICEVSGFKINYCFLSPDLHTFTVTL